MRIKIPISHRERNSYEQDVQIEGIDQFRFKQWTPDSNTKWTASDNKWAEEYFPVYFMQPFESNKPAFGIDLASNATRLKALEQSRDSGKAIATARITLAQETGDQAGVLVFVPIYKNGTPLESIEERRTHLRGFALGVYRVGDIVAAALAHRDIEGVHLRITDESADEDKRLLYESGQLPTDNASRDLQTTFAYDVGGRIWHFQFTATHDYVQARSGWQSWLVLIGGACVAMLVGLIINIMIGKGDAVEKLVQERTSALRIANTALAENEQRLRDSQAQLALHAEQLQASNGELEQFAYVASHDLQEPLRKVASFCQLLKDDYGPTLDDAANSYIDFAVDGAKRMKNLTSDLLSFSRVSAQGQALAPTNSEDSLKAAVLNLQMAIEERDAVVTSDGLPVVMADARQLTQLFQNLIGNAIKYYDETRPPIIVVRANLEDDRWIFSIRDNGIGIAENYRDRIFEIFKRLHDRDEYSGTGIGLAICKKIVDRMGGKIWVESNEDVGSTFYFSIPKLTDRIANSPVKQNLRHDEKLTTQ